MATQTLTTGSNANIFGNKTIAASQDPTRPVRTERIKLYKDFLTPAFHRRFCSAATGSLVLCLFHAFLLSGWRHPIWSWFPLGPAGIRAVLLFIPCLAVFIVRISNLHIGERTSSSPAQSVYIQVAGTGGILATGHTVLWYMFSGWFFGEVYIWSRSDKAELGIVDPGQAFERPRLNENPIFLRFIFVVLAVLQSVLHLVRDYDRVDTVSSKGGHQESSVITRNIGQTTLDKLPRPVRLLSGKIGSIVGRSVNLTVAGIFLVTLPLYFGFGYGFRYPAWNCAYKVAKIFFHSLPSQAPPTGLLHSGLLAWQCFTASLMLVSLWEVSNAFFTIFVAQEPLKRSQPLTSEIKDMRGVILHKSKDPNGSLLNGLKSRKRIPKSFAFWELDLICEQFETRRKTVYTEVDRESGSTWSQICKLCVDEINQIDVRINAASQPAGYKTKQDEEALHKQQQQQKQQQHMAGTKQEQTGLKKIADQKVIDDADVFVKQRSDFYGVVGNMAKSIGSQPGAHNPVAPRARKVIEWSADQVLSKEDQQRFRPERLEQQASGYVAQLLRSPVGEPFRQTFARKVTSTILGAPNSSRTNIIHATKAVSKLITMSLREDTYGQVQKDIKVVIVALTGAIKSVEKFVQEAKPHWTDVEFVDDRSRNVPEVKELLDVLKMGLEDIMLVFEEYANALHLTRKEVREAKEAMAQLQKHQPRIEGVQQQQLRPEMRQVR